MPNNGEANGQERGKLRGHWGYPKPLNAEGAQLAHRMLDTVVEYIGIMENKMETTIMGYIGYIRFGLYGDNGKENGTTIVYWGLYGDNGKENGNYYSILGFIWG